MSLDSTPIDLPLETKPGGSSPRLALIFLVLLGVLGLLGVSGTVASAVDTLLAAPVQSCGGG
ncbi:MAG TPA: hypothetical protein VL749_13245 [Patescibacteria group bacterium]|jgi:hypothetical protein|nr:hypothetical protein [Patescibacteria group bacterium]